MSNAQEVILEFGVAIDSVYLLSKAAVNKLVGSAEQGFAVLVEDCISTGTRTTTFFDNDGNNEPGSGDQFVIQYAGDCGDADADKALTGTITIDVASISFGNAMGFSFSGLVTFSQNLTMKVPGYERRLSGKVAVEALSAGGVQIFEARIPDGELVTFAYNSQIRPEGDSSSEITSFFARIESRRDANNMPVTLFDYSTDVESSRLGGSIHCESSRPIETFSGAPGTGENFECFGANGSAAIGQLVGSPRLFVHTHVDEDGDGTFELINAIDAFLLWLERPWVTPLRGYSVRADMLDYEPVTNIRFPIDVSDSAHDAANGRLYVLGPTDLVVFDDSDLSEVGRLSLAESYNTMAVSDSGATLWLAVSDKPELHSVDTSGLALSGSLTYSSPVPGVNVNYVEQLAVVPSSEDHVVALVDPRREITSFRSGSELPGTISMSSIASQIFVVADALTLYTSTGSRHPQENLIEVNIDPVLGLSSSREFPGYLGGISSTGLYSFDGDIIGNGGRAISTARSTVAGKYENFTVGTNGFVASPVLGKVFAIRNSNQLNIYRADSRALVGTYRLDDFILPAFRRSHVSDANLLLTFADMIMQIALSDVPDNNGRDTCKTEDFSGLLSPDTAFQITCPLESATYDPLRDRLYLGVSPDGGGIGNTIVRVNPSSGLVDASVIVGSRPGKTRMSNDGTALYVTLPDANELVEVSLSTFQVVRRLPLGLQTDYSFAREVPAFPTALDVTGLGSDEFVIAMNEGDLFHYSNGMQLPNKVTATRSFSDMHLASNGSKGVAIERGESQMVDVDASGVAQRSLLGSLLDGHPIYRTPVMRLGDELFKFDGDVFDLQAESVSDPCNRTVPDLSNGVAAPAPAGDRITYFLSDVSVESLTTCDRASGVSNPVPRPIFFGLRSRELLAAFHTQNDMLVIVNRHGASIVNAPR